MSKSFKAHGKFDLSICDNILLFYSKGPWNKELVDEIEETARPLIEQLSKNKWGVLLIPDGDAIHIPESEKKAVNLIKAAKKKGRVATAIMTEKLTSKAVIQNYLENLYTKGGEQVEFFDSIEKAKDWLKEMISKAEDV